MKPHHRKRRDFPSDWFWYTVRLAGNLAWLAFLLLFAISLLVAGLLVAGQVFIYFVENFSD